MSTDTPIRLSSKFENALQEAFSKPVTREDRAALARQLESIAVAHTMNVLDRLTAERNQFSTLHTQAVEKLREKEQEGEQLTSELAHVQERCDRHRVERDKSIQRNLDFIHATETTSLDDALIKYNALEKRNAELYDDLKDSKASWLEREHNLVRKIEQLRASLTRTRGIVVALVADWMESRP